MPEPSFPDDLECLEEIGRGAQGIVYKAHQHSMDRVVAVKVLPRTPGEDEEKVERFRREAEAAGRLNHPNIVAVHGLHTGDDALMLVQEYVDGLNLEEVVEEQRWEDALADDRHGERAAALCRQLAEALQHAHDRGVIHRDIKPGNVLVTRDGVPKITDFGLARVEDRHGLSQTGTILGTPRYMSPEQIDSGGRPVDGRADVYALGALLYRLLTGSPPFRAKTIRALFVDILNREPPSLRRARPDISRDLEAVCFKSLEKRPEDRYASAAEFAADLGRVLEQRPTLARPLGATGRAVKAVRRLATSSLALACVLVPTAWFTLDRLWLGPWAHSRPDVHDGRFAVAAVAALLLGWPLAVLARRLAGGRAAAAIASSVFVALAFGAVAWRVVEERTRQLHLADRSELTLHLGSMRPDTVDVDAFTSRWESRFEPEDLELVARILLQRHRPARARDWALHMEERATDDPVAWTLISVAHRAFGEDAAAQQAAGRAETLAAGAAWDAWLDMGDILRESRFYSEAHRAYEQGSLAPGAGSGRDELNLRMARILVDLCRESEARRYLEMFAAFHRTLPMAIRLQFEVAVRAGDWAAAEEHLQQLEAHEEVPLLEKLQARFAFLNVRGDADEAWALVAASLRDGGAEAVVVEWCGRVALQRARPIVRLARAYRHAAGQAAQGGDEPTASAHRATAEELAGEAAGLLAFARRAYETLGTSTTPGEGAFLSLSGLASVAVQEGILHPERAEPLLEEGVRLSEAALERDPSYHFAHYNCGLAHRQRSEARHGSVSAWPLEDLRVVVEHYENAVQWHGTESTSLNDTAFFLARLFERTQDRSLLERAERYAARLVRVGQPDPETSCAPSNEKRQSLAYFHDTRRDVLELLGDLEGAARSAAEAVRLLPDQDPYAAVFRQHQERLEQELAGG